MGKKKFSIKEYSKKYYIRNRKRILKNSAIYRSENKETIKTNTLNQNIRASKIRIDLRLKIIQHYGAFCVCCGEHILEFLAIDHKNNDGNYERKELKLSGIKFYRHIIDNNYPDKYRILCHNCNTSRGKYGYCPHERMELK